MHGDGVDDPIVWYGSSGTTNKRDLFKDERGSVIAADTGSSVTTIKYDEYGNPSVTGSTVPRFQYTASDDLAAFETGDGVSHRVSLTAYDVSDEMVIAAGQKVNAMLGTKDNPGPTDYDALFSGEGHANSNAAAARLLDEASPGMSKRDLIKPGLRAPGWNRPDAVGTKRPPPKWGARIVVP